MQCTQQGEGDQSGFNLIAETSLSVAGRRSRFSRPNLLQGRMLTGRVWRGRSRQPVLFLIRLTVAATIAPVTLAQAVQA